MLFFIYYLAISFTPIYNLLVTQLEFSMIKPFWKIPLWRKLLKTHRSKIAVLPHQLDSKSNISIEENVTLKAAKIDKATLLIGAYSYIRSGAYLTGDIRIGRYCSIANDVTIGLNRSEHPLDWLSTHPINKVNEAAYAKTLSHNSVTIGNDCWIGHGATILSGVTIGDGAVIGAGAVVTKNVPPYSIVVGNPGRVIRTRFNEATIDNLLTSAWWGLDHAFLESLPINDPVKSLQLLHGIRRGDVVAMYRRLSVSSAGMKILPSTQTSE